MNPLRTLLTVLLYLLPLVACGGGELHTPALCTLPSADAPSGVPAEPPPDASPPLPLPPDAGPADATPDAPAGCSFIGVDNCNAYGGGFAYTCVYNVPVGVSCRWTAGAHPFVCCDTCDRSLGCTYGCEYDDGGCQ